MILTQTQRQVQRILPTQIQYLNLLKLQQHELQQAISEELEDNPLLETIEEKEEQGDDFDEALEYAEADSYDDGETLAERGINDRKLHEEKRDMMSNTPCFDTSREDLKNDLRSLHLTARQFDIVCYIVDSLDEDGYLRTTTSEIMDELSFAWQMILNPSDIEEAIELVQQCDPVGVGARNLQECLLLQLFRKEKKSKADVIAYDVVEESFDLMCSRSFEKIRERHQLTSEQLQSAMEVIKKLKAKPAQLDSTKQTERQQAATVDFVIAEDENGVLCATLTHTFAPNLRFNNDTEKELAALLRKKKKSAKEQERETFLKSKMQSAKWFVDCINQRERSLQLVINAILRKQKAYLLSGDKSDLKPMILQDIAEQTGLDVSTVSRITSTRCADTPVGTIYLKELFTQSIATEEGEAISNAGVKQMLVQIIASENKLQPLNDVQIAKLLEERGVKIARRTVVKYRELMNVPAAKLRYQAAAAA
ncbi:MAG: RNA polymerase factor sigma-54 [Chitinophagales bacterium]